MSICQSATIDSEIIKIVRQRTELFPLGQYAKLVRSLSEIITDNRIPAIVTSVQEAHSQAQAEVVPGSGWIDALVMFTDDKGRQGLRELGDTLVDSLPREVQEWMLDQLNRNGDITFVPRGGKRGELPIRTRLAEYMRDARVRRPRSVQVFP